MPRVMDECVQKVKKQGRVDNAYAVCTAAMKRKMHIKGKVKRAELNRLIAHKGSGKQ